MAQDTLTFEEIDRHINASDLEAFATGGKHFVTAESLRANPAAAIPNICAAYKVIKPILQALLLMPFIPARWKQAIQAFMSVLNTLCP
jgi:hypothetical protein